MAATMMGQKPSRSGPSATSSVTALKPRKTAASRSSDMDKFERASTTLERRGFELYRVSITGEYRVFQPHVYSSSCGINVAG